MGLDYSYLLYFKREQLWGVLQGVVDIAKPHHPPTQIQFPDHVLSVPLDSWLLKGKEAHYNDPEFSFSTVLIFEEDEAIQDYSFGRNNEVLDSNLPGTNSNNRISIGYIYLTVYNDLPQRLPEQEIPGDLILLDFGTTGSKMSMLFFYSTSIRNTFIGLLEKFGGVCGVFNKEEEGEVFWLNGKKITGYIDDPWLLPEEIELKL